MRVFVGTLLTFALASLLSAQQPASPTNTATPESSASTQPNPQPQPDSSSVASESGPQPAPSQAAASQGDSSQQASQPGTTPSTAVFLPTVSKREAAEAKRQFEAGVKLKKKVELDAAFVKFVSASQLDPTNYNYLTAREFTRQELAMQALQRGNKAMLDHNEVVAMAEFQRALQYDDEP